VDKFVRGWLTPMARTRPRPALIARPRRAPAQLAPHRADTVASWQ
jgi:hypothetical protein